MMKRPTSHYINGQWIQGLGETFASTNPVNQNTIWQGTMATAEEVHQAYHAAKSALPSWSSLSLNTRIQSLKAFARCIEKHRQQLTELISEETGKPHWEALTETQAVIAKVDISIQAYQERCAEKIITDATGTSGVRYKPHGVVAVLGPFNFPAHLSNGHIVPALLAGNTIVYKPSELTPSVAELIVQCWHESGLPYGVLNLIQGARETAQHLLQENIQGVSFTGSYQTGLSIHQQMSMRPAVILALEMGGNNPLIIDHVHNISAAVYQTILSSFITAGQRCTCARRIFIPNNTYGDEVVTRLIHSSKKIKIGAPHTRPEPFMGPVISNAHAHLALKAEEALRKLGGESLLNMSLLEENASFLSPGIMEMTAISNPPDEEIFAPFIQIHRYQHFEEALTLANQTQYGLAAGLLSDDPNQYQQFFDTINAGLIYWNRATTGASSSLPFGGVGHSGNHRPSAYFAADYCAYPIANLLQTEVNIPNSRLPGLEV